MLRRGSTYLLSSVVLLAGGAAALACPFCSSVSQTLTEEINSMQVVTVVRLIEAPPPPAQESTDPNAPLPKAKFRIQDVIKGSEFVNKGDVVDVLYFGEANKERPYLLMGTDPPRVVWSTPLGLSQRSYEYVMQLLQLPVDHRRLEFFQEYFEDDDEMLARDAYDEFAKAPYDDVVALKDKMHHDRLIAWIKDPDVPASRRRLYFTMLGVCGQPQDVPLLDAMMRSNDRQSKAGLDALIACYLMLSPQQGLGEVEELFLKNKQAEYADTYAAIMAIRFHGNQVDRIAKTQLVRSLRHLLERPELADLVIPDLARWQDWEVLPRMVQLFKEADEKSSWVRVPVINFLRSCPLPEAKAQIEELSKIDPEAVKRAQTFFPFDAQGDGGAATQPKADQSPNEPSSQAPTNQQGADAGPALVPPAVAPRVDPLRATSTRPVTTQASHPGSAQAVPATRRLSQTDAAAAGQSAAEWSPNRWILLGVPVVSGVVLMLLLRSILGYPWIARSTILPR
jgi:hypothetical protein